MNALRAAVNRPRLEWSQVPPNTAAFVLHMHDPDVAKQKTTGACNKPAQSRDHKSGNDCRRMGASSAAASVVPLRSGRILLLYGRPTPLVERHWNRSIKMLAMSHILRCVVLAVIVPLSSLILSAQTSSSQLTGILTDPAKRAHCRCTGNSDKRRYRRCTVHDL